MKMRIPAPLRRAVQRLLAGAGFTIVNLNADRARLAPALDGIAARHPGIATVIDVGASDGRWSAALMPRLPRARYLLVEAQTVHKPALDRFCRAHPNAQVALAAAGDRQGTISFDVSTPHGGQASAGALGPGARVATLPMTTIDHEVQSRGLRGPYLIKLDTHGFEVPILAGAAATLAATEVVVIECYNFKISPEALLFFELCAYMAGLGFRPIDLFDPLHRPYDNALWQFDLVFARASSPAFQHPGYE